MKTSPPDLNEAPVLRWYVVETDVSQERAAEQHLREKQFEVYLPMRRAGAQAKRICAVAYFPRYLFVRLEVGAPGWTGVFSARGVKGLLGNIRPLPLSDNLIAIIRAREHDGFIPVKAKAAPTPYEHGELVRVASGPFEGYNAIFEQRVDAKRVAILLSFLGRDSRVVADLASLRKVS